MHWNNVSIARRTFVATSVCGLITTASLGQTCQLGWSPMNYHPFEGTNPHVDHLMTFDDGSGTALYAATPASASSQSVTRWNGTDWVALGQLTGEPYRLVAFDDGSGRALYAIGRFFFPGTSPTMAAKWTGSEWVSVNLPLQSTNYYLITGDAFDDGSGPALYVAATYGGTTRTSELLRWDGHQTTTVLPLSSDRQLFMVKAMAEGGHDALYVGGQFDSINGTTTHSLARFDGTTWSALGGGPPILNVWDAQWFDDGLGPALFTLGDPGSSIARWNGSAWTSAPVPVPSIQYCFAAFDDGSGTTLFVGARATTSPLGGRGLYKLTPSGWVDSSGGVGGGGPYYPQITTMTVFDDGSGPSLIVGGTFTKTSTIPAPLVARWGCTTYCYANCDGSTTIPALNVNDFVCFLQRFAAGDPYANCDASYPTSLTVSDLICFQQRFAAGCP